MNTDHINEFEIELFVQAMKAIFIYETGDFKTQRVTVKMCQPSKSRKGLTENRNGEIRLRNVSEGKHKGLQKTTEALSTCAREW